MLTLSIVEYYNKGLLMPWVPMLRLNYYVENAQTEIGYNQEIIKFKNKLV